MKDSSLADSSLADSSLLERIQENKKVEASLKIVRSLFGDQDPKQVSDVYQLAGDIEYQYVDLVMGGGGVLGLALIGYIYAMEQAHIRFLSVGGTSAGGIAALLLTGAGYRDESKSEKLLEILFQMAPETFIDGKWLQRKISNQLGRAGKVDASLIIKLVIEILLTFGSLKKNLGLNPGNKFEEWLGECLRQLRINNLSDLQAKIDKLPVGLINRNTGLPINKLKTELAIVAADISTESKVVFPKHAKLYWDDYEKTDPAKFVRASMSIPFLFFPYSVTGLHAIPNLKERWQEISYQGDIPDKILFVDGGAMSNFPIDLFHEPQSIPLVPTFGVRLNSNKRVPKTVNNVFGFGIAMLKAMMHYGLYDFITKNSDYCQLISHVDTAPYSKFNFHINEEEKIDLFVRGVEAARDFLINFNWEKYKETRCRLANRTWPGIKKISKKQSVKLN